MSVPNWYELLLLILAAFRTWHLLAEDTLIESLRERVLGLQGWVPGTQTPVGYREGLAEFVNCPWCFGGWIAIGWWVAWQLWPHGTLVLSGLAAIMTGVALTAQISSRLGKGE